MKESFSGTALFMIVIFFIILFAGYLCFSINQSRAFSVKNAIVRIVERYGYGEGNDPKHFETIAAFRDDITRELKNVGYTTTGNCGTGWIAFNVLGRYMSSGEGAFCIKYFGSSSTSRDNPARNLHYYKIKTFYHFDVPGVKELLRMTVEGNTKSMQ